MVAGGAKASSLLLRESLAAKLGLAKMKGPEALRRPLLIEKRGGTCLVQDVTV